MSRLFGTDGVRGVANRDLTPELAYRLARAGAWRLSSSHRPTIIVGRDTRLSGEMLEAAMVAGFASMGADVRLVGVTTTPSIAYLTRALGADAGVMISASHNPFPDNGIKFFSGDGFKLPDEVEDKIEEEVRRARDELPRPEGTGIGRVRRDEAAVSAYVEHLARTISGSLEGLKLVVDCANGSASLIAPTLLRHLGATVTAIHASPDGQNINVACGSTHPASLQRAVVEHGADAGLAYDGDADRVIAVDERGELVDGDQIMAICALRLAEHGQLPGNTIVATVMSNYGLEAALRPAGVRIVRTAVGDRYVLAEMLSGGYRLGGEQSGHIIFLDLNTTGDGLATSLQLLSILKESGGKLSELAAVMEKYPQVLKNYPAAHKERLQDNAAIRAVIARVEMQLGEEGRVLVRPSGTERLVRVMVEGKRPLAELEALVEEIGSVVQQELA